MSAVTRLNPNAQTNVGQQAINISISAAKGLQDVLKSNLGPKGTMKLLVGGSGDLKMTKDGNVLLHEMQIQHPTAALIARTATSQDDITGDGTTSNVLLIAELLKQSERFLQEGLHPRIITDGFELAKVRALEFLEKFRVEKDTLNRELLINVARTSLRTKVYEQLADSLTEVVTDAILTIRRGDEPVDLFMVEIMTMQHQSDRDTKLIKGLVLDHGSRHPDMPKRLENCFVLICNVSFEYEKSEINTNIMYRSAEEKAQVVNSERKWVEDRVKKVIELKKKVCDTPDKNFVVINQKGIDPGALEMFAHAGIIALRRAKRRNMERLTLACGGTQVNSVDDDLNESVLGYAGLVYEHVLGEDKYTFVEGVTNPFSVSILIKGSNKHSLSQIQDAVRDGLRAVKNTIEDKSVVPGAGAFQIAAHADLMKYKQEVSGRTKLGVQAFADALLIIPKVLASNSGFDPIDAIVTLQEEYAKGHIVGLDLSTGDCLSPAEEGIWDNYRVVRQLLNSCSVIATQLLLVDEIMRAGKNFGKTG